MFGEMRLKKEIHGQMVLGLKVFANMKGALAIYSLRTTGWKPSGCVASIDLLFQNR